MKRIIAASFVLVLLTGAAVAYASGGIDVPAICDPADTQTELPGQWGARIVDGDCFDRRARRAVVVRDNDYAYQRSDCVVFATRSDANVQILFRNPDELVITSAAGPLDDLAFLDRCGPVQVILQRT